MGKTAPEGLRLRKAIQMFADNPNEHPLNVARAVGESSSTISRLRRTPKFQRMVADYQQGLLPWQKVVKEPALTRWQRFKKWLRGEK